MSQGQGQGDGDNWGIAHVYASFNNTLITVTDQTAPPLDLAIVSAPV